MWHACCQIAKFLFPYSLASQESSRLWYLLVVLVNRGLGLVGVVAKPNNPCATKKGHFGIAGKVCPDGERRRAARTFLGNFPALKVNMSFLIPRQVFIRLNSYSALCSNPLTVVFKCVCVCVCACVCVGGTNSMQNNCLLFNRIYLKQISIGEFLSLNIFDFTFS